MEAAAEAAPSVPSRAGGRQAVAAGLGWPEPRTPGPRFPARLQAPGLGQQDSCDPRFLQAARRICASLPGPGIMGNGMTKVRRQDAGSTEPLTSWAHCEPGSTCLSSEPLRTLLPVVSVSACCPL